MRWGCQRNNQRSPKILLFVISLLRLPPGGVPLCMGRSAGKRSVPFQSQIPCSPCPGLRPSACRRQGVCGCMRSACFCAAGWQLCTGGSFGACGAAVMPICSTDAAIAGRKCLDCRCISVICLAILKTECDDEPLSAAQRFFFFR